jgi:hypothetical protein
MHLHNDYAKFMQSDYAKFRQIVVPLPPQPPLAICKLGGKVMEVMEVMTWEVMNSCSNGSNEEVIGLQNDHAVMKMEHGVMM